jgi:hypothetical protein
MLLRYEQEALLEHVAVTVVTCMPYAVACLRQHRQPFDQHQSLPDLVVLSACTATCRLHSLTRSDVGAKHV